MTALNSYFDELVNLYGFVCETGAAAGKWREYLETSVSDSSKTNSQSTIFFGRQNPNDPNAKHQYSRTVGDLITNSQQNGHNQLQTRRMIVAFAYALWEDKYRKEIALECGLPNKNSVMSEVFYDLNMYRQAILHASGRMDRQPKTMIFFNKGEVVEFSEAQIYELFRALIDELNKLSEEYYKQPGNFSIDRGF